MGGAPKGMILKKSNKPFDHVFSGNWPWNSWFRNLFLEFFGNQATKMMSFWKKLIIRNLVCIKTCYSFKLAKTLPMTQKHKSLRSWYSEITLIDVLGHVDQNYLFLGNTFWAIILSLDRTGINNLGPKGHPFKTILIWEEILQPGRPCLSCIIA